MLPIIFFQDCYYKILILVTFSSLYHEKSVLFKYQSNTDRIPDPKCVVPKLHTVWCPRLQVTIIFHIWLSLDDSEDYDSLPKSSCRSL